jgi:hypothetical protein
MLKYLSAAIAVLALGAALALRGGAAANEGKPPAEGGAELKGKVVAIGCKHSEKAGGVLEKVRMVRLGGREFLVGSPADSGREDDPYKGVKVAVWLPVEDIARMMEFDSLEEAQKVYKAFGNAQNE